MIEKLAALVPPPRLNLIRYPGVLAPNAADRKQIVPGPSEEGHSASGHEEESAERRTYRLSWCVLLGRVFQVDVTVCPDCGGSMKIVAALTEATSIRNYLLGVGLPCRAPPVAAARPDPQPQFEQT